MPIERTTGGTSLIDVLDRVLDKGIVIDAWVRVSLVGIDLITVEARVVVASIDTYLKYSESIAQVAPVSRPAAVASQEAVLAENAALRAQLAATPPAPGGAAPRRGRARRRDASAGLSREPRRCVGGSGATGRAVVRGAARPPGVPARVRGPGRDGRAVPRVARRARRRARGALPRSQRGADPPRPPGRPTGHARFTVNGFGVDLEALDHPLIKALSGSQPVVLARETAGHLFSRRAPFLALPLHGADAAEGPREGSSWSAR